MTNKDRAVAILSKRLRFKNPKGIDETYQYFARKNPKPDVTAVAA